jgi:isoquinoline 1-oxidoreductase beta subunit
MGISSVLKEQVTIEDGVVKQSNFNDYPLLRMDEVPESIDITFVKSSNYPQGVGESGTPLVACCIANAFLALTGKPLTHLPFTPERVLEVLNT